jgi:hypothetical protein
MIPVLVFVVIATVVNWKNSGNIQIPYIAIPVVGIAFGWMHLSKQPKEFTVRENELTLQLYLKKQLPRFVYVNKRNWTWARLLIVVRGVKQIQYRGFNGDQVGNIRIYGELYAQDYDGDCADIRDCPEYIEICGVQNLTEVLCQLKKAFPTAVQDRM